MKSAFLSALAFLSGAQSYSPAASKPLAVIAPAPALPKDYQDHAREVVQASLKDPESAHLEFRSEPYPMVCRKGVFDNQEPIEIWMIDVWVNARNSYGGYAGFQGWSVAFVPKGDGTATYQAYTALGGGAISEYKLCREKN